MDLLQANMLQRYLLLVKTSPRHTDDFVRGLKNLPDKPMPDVTLYDTYNIFGNWACCIWFEADSHENAVNFVQNKIRPWQAPSKHTQRPRQP